MRRVLLVADLEGITGVDSISALVFGAPSYPEAAARMTDEVVFVAEVLLGLGVESIVVSDAHRSGARTNLDAVRLPSGCEVRVEEDMYGGRLLDHAEAVVCVGMHALGRSAGFGAHTVSVNTEWTLGALALSETHIARFLAAERGVPMWCSAGCDVLELQLGGGVPFVRTKRSTSRGEARSSPREQVNARFREVLAGAPAPLLAVPRAALRLRFQRSLEADAAEGAGGSRVSTTELEIAPLGSFQEQYDEGLRLVSSAEDALLARVSGELGTAEFAASAARLLLDDWAD